MFERWAVSKSCSRVVVVGVNSCGAGVVTMMMVANAMQDGSALVEETIVLGRGQITGKVARVGQ